MLITGERGSGKSTTVRAFSQMAYGRLPHTLPINATEARVTAGWRIDALLDQKAVVQEGILFAADGSMLYVDEVNLLDDHIVNILLDVAATGVLSVQREGIEVEKQVRFSLVGTMNPEEGALRPQLLDRFGLMVEVRGAKDAAERRQVIDRVLEMDDPECARALRSEDRKARERLEQARERAPKVKLSDAVRDAVARVAQAFEAVGSRGDEHLLRAARALAAIEGREAAELGDVERLAPLALRHRRGGERAGADHSWTDEDTRLLGEALAGR